MYASSTHFFYPLQDCVGCDDSANRRYVAALVRPFYPIPFISLDDATNVSSYQVVRVDASMAPINHAGMARRSRRVKRHRRPRQAVVGLAFVVVAVRVNLCLCRVNIVRREINRVQRI